MLALGWHGGIKARETEGCGDDYALHDGAAVLVEDGKILVAIEEERLNRVKHSPYFPFRSIGYCLEKAGITLDQVDLIAVNSLEEVFDFWVKNEFLDNPHEKHASIRGRLVSMFQEHFGVDVSQKLRFCKHHMAHAYAAYYPSGYDDALVVCIDGNDGAMLSGLIAKGEGDRLTVLAEYDLSQSLGEFYTNAIMYMGYNRFDEYKVMGLAPYGDPEVYGEMFRKFYKLLPDGNYQIVPDHQKLAIMSEYGLHISDARRKNDPFTQRDKDLAAALQTTLETIVLHVVTHFREQTGATNLCLGGGVAHNCTMNGRILYSEMFENIFVQPAAHDAGNALGAALGALADEGAAVERVRLEHLYYGSPIGDDHEIARHLQAWSAFVTVEQPEDIFNATAALIANGSVISWVQGDSEFGPRALGNRSILADPRPAENKQIINQMVKKREGYRPFAPSVLEERYREFFDIPNSGTDFFAMIFVVKVQEHLRSTLGAITHVDGTARIQTVREQTNPRYWRLIRAFEALTDIPIVLNTSYNNNAEPIVNSIEDAISCYLTTGIHYLAMGNQLVTKKDVAPAAYLSLRASLRPSRKLVASHRYVNGQIERVYTLDLTANRFFGEPHVGISMDFYRLLNQGEEGETLSETCQRLGIRDEETLANLGKEAYDLWSRRALVLRPVGCPEEASAWQV